MRWILRKFIRQTLLGFTLVDGAGADTDIAVSGIKETDSLLFCLESAASTALLTDRTSATSITSDGNIQCSTATTGDKLLVVWQKRS